MKHIADGTLQYNKYVFRLSKERTTNHPIPPATHPDPTPTHSAHFSYDQLLPHTNSHREVTRAGPKKSKIKTTQKNLIWTFVPLLPLNIQPAGSRVIFAESKTRGGVFFKFNSTE